MTKIYDSICAKQFFHTRLPIYIKTSIYLFLGTPQAINLNL